MASKERLHISHGHLHSGCVSEHPVDAARGREGHPAQRRTRTAHRHHQRWSIPGGFMVAPRALIASLAVVGFSSVLVAQAPALDLKVGLWEHTIVTSMSGVPPVDTSKMSPEQAARAAEAMKAMGNDKSVTTKTCLQKEDLAKDSFMMPNSANMTCTRKVT